MARKTVGYVELEWNCPNCGTVNPGPEQTCTNCGAPQPDDVKFVQSKREDLISDEAVKAKVEAGADIHCPYCGTRNTAGTEVCSHCGGDLTEGLRRESGRVVGAFKTGPVTQVPCPHCGADNPDTARTCSQCGGSMQIEEPVETVPSQPPKVEKPPKKSSPLGYVIAIGALILICAVVGVLVVLSMRTEAITGTVEDVEWKRAVVVEALAPVEHSDWYNSIPNDAEIGTCEQKVRSIQDEPAANSVEVCGTPYTVDTGSGYGEVVQDCEYEVYDDFCTYSVVEWQAVDEVVLTGNDYVPLWPEPTLEENERLGTERNETYVIVFDAGGDTYTFTTSDFNLYQASQIGSEWNLNVNTFGSVVSIEQ